MRPRSHTLVKKPVLKPEFQRLRPEVKTSAGEGGVVKPVARKTPAVTTKRVVTVAKQEAKKPEPIQEIQTEVKPQLPTKKVCGGHYELNALMTRMVDAELQDVMNKVMEELPDASPTDTESTVIETLKKKARDDLKNVIGLNITKRLLNVFNPLGVKVKFNGKPEKEELREFLKKYNFTAFARKAVNIFAAQVRSIDDFDRICSEEDVRCGSVKVTVTPVYRFTTCPPNLKTNYKDIDYEDFETESIDEDIEMKDLESKKVETAKIANKSPLKNDTTSVKEEKTNIQVTTSQTKPVSNISPTKNLEVKNSTETTKKPEPPKAIKTEQVTETNSENKVASPQKPTKVTNPTKTEVTPANTETKVTPTKPVTKVTPTKPVPKVAPAKPVPKVAPAKPVPKVAPAKPVPKMTPTKPVTKSTPNNTTKITPTKPVTKKTPQKSTNTAKKSTKVDDDYDELNDYDILALMSEGIVLDECSGSDEE